MDVLKWRWDHGKKDIFSYRSNGMSEDIPGMVLQELRSPTDDWRRVWKSFIDLTNHFYFYSNHNLSKLQFTMI